MKKRSLMIWLAIVCVIAACGTIGAFAAVSGGGKSNPQKLSVGTNEVFIDLGSVTSNGTPEFYPGSYMTFSFPVEISDSSPVNPITEADITISLVAIGDCEDDPADFFTVTVAGNATEGKVANGEIIVITVALNINAEKPDFTSFKLCIELS